MSELLGVLSPIPISSAMLISSTVTETDYPAWSNATTYALGQRCISTTTHRIYESAAAGNINHDPTDEINRAGATVWWIEIDSTNRWVMFDGEKSSQTITSSPLTVVLRPGGFNAVYLGGLDTELLTITVTELAHGAVIYNHTDTLESSCPGDYFEYFFDRFKPQTDFLVSNIDQYYASEITITLSKVSGSVACGIVAIGDLRPLGSTQRGAKAKPKTYSYIKVDDYGNNTIKRRKSAADMSASATLDLAEANTVLSDITALLDVPCVWIAASSPEYSGLRCYGLGSGEVSYDNPLECLLTLNVIGLI